MSEKMVRRVSNKSSRYFNIRISKTCQDGKMDGYQCSLIANDTLDLSRTWSLSVVSRCCATRNLENFSFIPKELKLETIRFF